MPSCTDSTPTWSSTFLRIAACCANQYGCDGHTCCWESLLLRQGRIPVVIAVTCNYLLSLCPSQGDAWRHQVSARLQGHQHGREVRSHLRDRSAHGSGTDVRFAKIIEAARPLLDSALTHHFCRLQKKGFLVQRWLELHQDLAVFVLDSADMKAVMATESTRAWGHL